MKLTQSDSFFLLIILKIELTPPLSHRDNVPPFVHESAADDVIFLFLAS